MPTFEESRSGKPRKVGALERPDYYYLEEEDSCYFFGEYTAGKSY